MLRFLSTLIVLLVLVFAAAGGALFWHVNSPLVLKSDPVEFHIAPGSGLRAAAREIATAGVGIEPWVLVILGRGLGVDTAIKAGSYEVTSGITPLDLLRKLTQGDVTQTDITFV